MNQQSHRELEVWQLGKMVHITITHRHQETLLDKIPQEENTTLVSSFVELVKRNQIGATKKSKLLHGNVKDAESDVSTPFPIHLQSNPTLETSEQNFLILQWQIRGYKLLDPPMKHQKDIQVNLVSHIYNKQHSHLSTAIGELIPSAFFFDI